MKRINKIIFTIVFGLLSCVASANIISKPLPMNGMSFVKSYLNPSTHAMMIGYSMGLVNGFNKGLSYEGKHIDCLVPKNYRIIDVTNSIAIMIVSNKHLQKEHINESILEGFALSFCKKAGEQT